VMMTTEVVANCKTH